MTASDPWCSSPDHYGSQGGGVSANRFGEGGRDVPGPERYRFGGHGDRGTSPVGQGWTEPAPPFGGTPPVFWFLLYNLGFFKHCGGGPDLEEAFVCPSRALPARIGLAPAETSRGPRGIREDIVQDLGRLYRLRRPVTYRTTPGTEAGGLLPRRTTCAGARAWP